MKNFNSLDLDAFGEFIGIGLRKAAEVLNTMLSSPVKLSIVDIMILSKEDLFTNDFPFKRNRYSVVEMNYSGSISGTTSLIITHTNALKIVNLLVGEELSDKELDAIRVGTLSEIGNIVINAILGMISNVLQLQLTYSIPLYRESEAGDLILPFRDNSEPDKVFVKIKSSFLIRKHSASGDIILFFNNKTFEKLNNLIKNYNSGNM